jgi:UDP-N-acetylglucosamine--N-acetylmuramyl-(pentapeptide) pyrophosphoryl-undecaprenol N-acetylglucosamine transferase
MRLLICAGGTGGGVYPALNVLRELPEDDLELLWVGGDGGMEAELVKREDISFASIPAAGVHGVGLSRLPGNVISLIKGFFKAKQVLKRYQPDVLLFTGGYVAVPMALAATRYPSLLFVPDIEPGLALKLISFFANLIAVPNADSLPYFPSLIPRHKIKATGYPVKPTLAKIDLTSARESLHLHDRKPVVLVFGGSKGAQTINRALVKLLPSLLQKYQIVHITGTTGWEEVQAQTASFSPELASAYHPYAYLHEEMPAALRAADLIVSRAGASILGEYPVLGTPAILVPYPYAWRYQKINAEYLASRGAARFLPDEQLAIQLEEMIDQLLNNPAEYQSMQQAMLLLRQPDAAANIAQLLLTLGGSKTGTTGRENTV